jgi:hypothetical protein
MLSPLEDAIACCPNNSDVLLHLQMVRRNSRRLLKLVNTLLQVKFLLFLAYYLFIFIYLKPNIKHAIYF